MNKITRFLVVKIGAFGDVIYALPLIEALYKFSPDAEIRWIIGQPLNTLLEGNPCLRVIETIDSAKLFSSSRKNKILETFRLSKLSAGSYEAIFIGHRDLRYALSIRPFVQGPIYILAREKPKGWRGVLLSRLGIKSVVVAPRELNESHAFRRMTAMALNEPDEKKIPWIWNLTYITPTSSLTFSPPYWVFHIGGGLNAKTEFRVKAWPYWAELCLEFLSKNYADIVLIGSLEEASNIPAIFEHLKKRNVNMARLHNLVGKTSLREIVNTIRSASGFIGPDSGPLHLADALGIPLVGLYGATSTITYGLINSQDTHILRHELPCSPCYTENGFFPDCPYEILCMKEIKTLAVLEKIEDLRTRTVSSKLKLND
jgi:ADP-heptose:LPS heptosyltransferase